MRSLVAALLLCVGVAPALAETGIASTYGDDESEAWHCVAEQKPAGGGCKLLDPGALSAAHRTLPFGTVVKVTNSRNGRSVMVRINDRGPHVAGRIIDLTPKGARVIGSDGLAPVTVTVP